MFVAPAVCRRCSGESAQSTTTTGTAGLETRQKIYRPEARRETRGFVLHRTTHYRQLVVTPVNDDFCFRWQGAGARFHENHIGSAYSAAVSVQLSPNVLYFVSVLFTILQETLSSRSLNHTLGLQKLSAPASWLHSNRELQYTSLLYGLPTVDHCSIFVVFSILRETHALEVLRCTAQLSHGYLFLLSISRLDDKTANQTQDIVNI